MAYGLESDIHLVEATGLQRRGAQKGERRLSFPPIISALFDPAEDATCLPDTATLDQRRKYSRAFLCFVLRRLALPFKTC